MGSMLMLRRVGTFAGKLLQVFNSGCMQWLLNLHGVNEQCHPWIQPRQYRESFWLVVKLTPHTIFSERSVALQDHARHRFIPVPLKLPMSNYGSYFVDDAVRGRYANTIR